MKRTLDLLSDRPFDLVVIGGGILGACIARDAALRGLSVALVEKQDFAASTSANSLKIIHGGLRYLQHLDLARMRSSIRERSIWLRIAPHLVEPLPFLVPTSRSGLQRKLLLRAALLVNDVVSLDRNRRLPPGWQIPTGRVLSRGEALGLVPELESRGLTGGVIFFDARMYSAERIGLGVVRGAHAAGAVVANYVEVERRRTPRSGMETLVARDQLSGSGLEIRSRLVVNAAGPAAGALAARLLGRETRAATTYSLALNLGFPALGHRVAFTLPASSRNPGAVILASSRQLLAVPWRGSVLVGTAHYPFAGEPGEFRGAEAAAVARFLDEVNRAWPGTRFDPAEIRLVHAGLLPALPTGNPAAVRLLGRHRVIDHRAEGAPGLLTAISVKYTTARRVAEEVVNHLFVKLGSRPPPCRTATTLLPDAPPSVEELLSRARGTYGELLPPAVIEHLVRSYGTAFERVLAYRYTLPGWNEQLDSAAPVIRAELAYCAAEEMACRPEDLVHRRTELGPRGLASEAALAAAREALAAAAPGANLAPG